MKHTSNPLEIETKRTTPTAPEVYALLVEQWGDQLTEEGCLSLTAQFWHETQGGVRCYNWNLGNIKASERVPHMFLRNVWEVYKDAAKAELAARSAYAQLSPGDPRCPPGCAIVVFQPPHNQCRFRAYASLEEGAARWVAHHREIAANDADYVPNLNAGRLPEAARDMKEADYFTALAGGYGAAMLRARETVLKLLG